MNMVCREHGLGVVGSHAHPDERQLLEIHGLGVSRPTKEPSAGAGLGHSAPLETAETFVVTPRPPNGGARAARSHSAEPAGAGASTAGRRAKLVVSQVQVSQLQVVLDEPWSHVVLRCFSCYGELLGNPMYVRGKTLAGEPLVFCRPCFRAVVRWEGRIWP